MGVFAFKKFSVCDDGAVMKVGTDAVLLGAWPEVGQAESILDIGTGSGVIALMMAQRTAADAKVDAVELQAEDARQAIANVSVSPWPEKIMVIRTGIQDYFPSKNYDLIVCNPPYFSKSLLPPQETRSLARHDETLSFDELILAVARLLAPNGSFCTILPPAEGQQLESKVALSSLFLQRSLRFFTRAEKPQERTLMQFGFTPRPLASDSLYLYAHGNEWTEEYKQLTQEFYLER